MLGALALAVTFAAQGCADHGAMRSAPTAALQPSVGSEAKADSRSIADPDPADFARLAELWDKRTGPANSALDYPIGPGDVLTVSAPEIDELKEKKVRVSAQGDIELPLIGSMQAGGLTEDDLTAAIDRKLEKYMFHPHASVFVNEYRNREVAVVGAVNKPGLVVLDNPSETILDALTEAGGVESTAADELVLIPGDSQAVASVRTIGATAGDPHTESRALAAAGSAGAVSISLRSTSLTGSGRYLSLPVRPGDVIVVPGGGQVMVLGWVQNPGHFPVGSGLTALGAIGEAGGPMYAADTKAITLIRSERDGSKSTIELNLEKIAHGEEPDVPVKANDVLDVPYSNLRIGPYVFYSVLTKIGLAAPVIPY